METLNIMMSLHTSAGLITIDKSLDIPVGLEDLEIERSLRSILKASQEYLILEDAVTKKRCVIEPKNILFISYDAELLAKKIEKAQRKDSERLVTAVQLKEMFDKRPSPKYEAVLGEVTYQDSIPGNLIVENPSKNVVIENVLPNTPEVIPDWLIKVE